ncbi:unnamed protein product [Anisakis simplex]|uniref:Uncharacterized protein n=1 Tax=Anisakis simplex TaxID=6269 RepID=A0A0M3JMP5_ANISI|nr:unnamed protein product [Anisakis simplex]
MHIQYERELTDPHYTTGWLYFFVASFCAHETVHQENKLQYSQTGLT